MMLGMAARAFAPRTAARARAGVKVSRCLLATVSERTVKVTFVNLEGSRVTVPGLVGQNLLEVAQAHQIELDGCCKGGGMVVAKRHSDVWTEDLFGAGPNCSSCHVLIPHEFASKIPEPFPKETSMLEECDEDYIPGSSRLGCQVTLTKELDGITCYIPDSPPIGP